MTERQPNSEGLMAWDPALPGGTPIAPEVWAAPEKQDPRIAELTARLELGYQDLLTSEGFTRWLDFSTRFRRYSPKNQILILSQDPDATRVASFDDWKNKHGRRVMKGEKGIKVFYPMKKWVEEVDKDTGELTRELQVVGFGIGNVFDIRQTDGPPVPEPPKPSEQFATSDVAGEIEGRMEVFAIGRGIRLESLPMLRARGKWMPLAGPNGTIVIASDLLADIGRAKTTAHELAHALAGHTGGNSADVEPVAEGAAHVTLKYFGVDTDDYTYPYVAYFQRDPAQFTTKLPEIQNVASQLIRAIEDPGNDPALMPSWN